MSTHPFMRPSSFRLLAILYLTNILGLKMLPYTQRVLITLIFRTSTIFALVYLYSRSHSSKVSIETYPYTKLFLSIKSVCLEVSNNQ